MGGLSECSRIHFFASIFENTVVSANQCDISSNMGAL